MSGIRESRATARQTLDLRCQVITEKTDQPTSKGREIRVNFLSRLGQSMPPHQIGEGRDWIAFARFEYPGIVAQGPVWPGRFEDRSRPCGEDAPASGFAESGPALQQRGFRKPPDHRCQSAGRHAQYLVYGNFTGACRHD